MFASECTPNSRSPSRTTFQRYNEFGGPVCLCTLQQDARVCCRLISSSLRPNVLRKVKQKNISARRRPRCDSWPSATLTVSTTAVRVRSCACVCYFTHRPRFSFLQSWLSECHTVLVRCPATAHTPFPGAPCDARFQQCGEIERERERDTSTVEVRITISPFSVYTSTPFSAAVHHHGRRLPRKRRHYPLRQPRRNASLWIHKMAARATKHRHADPSADRRHA